MMQELHAPLGEFVCPRVCLLLCPSVHMCVGVLSGWRGGGEGVDGECLL